MKISELWVSTWFMTPKPFHHYLVISFWHFLVRIIGRAMSLVLLSLAAKAYQGSWRGVL